jgi:transcription initiation factor TFIID subunit 5
MVTARCLLTGLALLSLLCTSCVQVVRFHPNCHYLATGSSDCSIRLWDVSVGSSVRILLGHTAAVTAMEFDAEGRHLFTGSTDGGWIEFDISSARIVAQGRLPSLTASFASSSSPPLPDRVTSLSVSGQGDMLATGSLHGAVSVWNVNSGSGGGSGSGVSSMHGRSGMDVQALQTWRTKQTSITHLHFTPRNLLLAAGVFHVG